MPGAGTMKDENHPHPSLPRRGGGIQKGGHFHINVVRVIRIAHITMIREANGQGQYLD